MADTRATVQRVATVFTVALIVAVVAVGLALWRARDTLQAPSLKRGSHRTQATPRQR